MRETIGVVELGSAARARDEHAVDAKARRESGAGGLEMDVARAGVVRVAHEEVHVANDRRLVREIAHVGGEPSSSPSARASVTPPSPASSIARSARVVRRSMSRSTSSPGASSATIGAPVGEATSSSASRRGPVR